MLHDVTIYFFLLPCHVSITLPSHLLQVWAGRRGMQNQKRRDMTWSALFESAVRATVEIDGLPCGFSLRRDLSKIFRAQQHSPTSQPPCPVVVLKFLLWPRAVTNLNSTTGKSRGTFTVAVLGTITFHL